MKKEKNFEMINLIHYGLLRHKSFEKIAAFSFLSDKELIEYINIINSLNYQKVPINIENGVPKLDYEKKMFHIHKFPFQKKRIKLMIVSDKHIDHAYDRIGYIEDVYEEAQKRGVDYVFDLGDILNGPTATLHNPGIVRSGTLEGSIERLIKYHPTNIPTYFLTGNHDLKFMDYNSCDIGRLIEEECRNMIFLNNLFTCVEIGDLRINLSHGSIEEKKLADIKLYKQFKFLTANDPHLICQGHFHIFDFSDKYYPALYQVPSLKSYASYKMNDKINKCSDIGALFLTITETSNRFEIESEVLEFIEEKKLVKTEIAVSKKKHICNL